jgi:hypothetical protein
MGKIVLDLDRSDVSVEQFTEAFRLQVRLAEEVMKEMGIPVEEVRWVVSELRYGSTHAAATPQLVGKKVFMADVDSAMNYSGAGVNELAKSSARPRFFNDVALNYSRRLIEIVEEADHGKARLVFGTISVAPSIAVSANVHAIIKGEVPSIGSIEGQLVGVEGADGNYKISIKDQRRNRKVPCSIHEKDQLKKALDNFEKRVIVRGMIWSREDGTPVKIEVRSLEPIPPDEELPTRQDVRGILRDFRRADGE